MMCDRRDSCGRQGQSTSRDWHTSCCGMLLNDWHEAAHLVPRASGLPKFRVGGRHRSTGLPTAPRHGNCLHSIVNNFYLVPLLNSEMIGRVGLRQRQWAKRARAKLLEALGGCCRHCGSLDSLEFDCIIPKGDRHHRLSSADRVSFYRLEHSLGNLQILCASCHNLKSIREYATTVLSVQDQHP